MKYILIGLAFIIYLQAPTIVLADTLPFNPSSSITVLDNYNGNYAPASGFGCDGNSALTYNGYAFFDRNCASYDLNGFQRAVRFHVVANNDFTGSAYLSTWWGNTIGDIHAYGLIQTASGSSTATFNPSLTWDGGSSGFNNVTAVPITLTYPFDVTFVYQTKQVQILINNAVILDYPVDVSVDARTVIIGQSLQIGTIDAQTTNKDDYISCNTLDLQCNLYNFGLFWTKLLMPTSASLDQIATISTAMSTKIPFAYFSTIGSLDFSNSNVATSTPEFTLPVMTAVASSSGHTYRPTLTGSTAVHFDGTALVSLGNYFKPIIEIGLWLLYIVVVVQVTIGMLT